MSAEEFWKDDPQLFNSYRISFLQKKKREMEEEDYKGWLHGLYIYNGNSLLFAGLRQFFHNIIASFTKASKDNSKIESYPSKPYRELQKDQEQKEQKEQEQKNNNYKQFESDLVYFGTLKKQYLEKLSKKGE